MADRVQPLVDRLAARILHEAYVVGTDAAGLPVLGPTTPDNIQRGTMWVVLGHGTLHTTATPAHLPTRRNHPSRPRPSP